MSEPFDFDAFIAGTQLPRRTIEAYRVDNSDEIRRLQAEHDAMARVLSGCPTQTVPAGATGIGAPGSSVSGGGTYSSGQPVTLTAVPAATAQFSHWVGDDGCNGNANPFTFTPRAAGTANPANVTCSAAFGRIDADGDGYSPPEDCNDNDPNIHPGAAEICDRKDNDCDPTTPELDCGGVGCPLL